MTVGDGGYAVLDPDPPWNDEDEESDTEGKRDESVTLEIESICLEQNTRKTHPSIKIKGLLMGRPCVFLIDCGATGDFISSRFIQDNDLRAYCTKHSLMVSFADGREYESRKELSNAYWSGGDFKESDRNFTIIDLPDNTYDAILGMPWLVSENPVVNWKKGTIYQRSPRLTDSVRSREDHSDSTTTFLRVNLIQVSRSPNSAAVSTETEEESVSAENR
jgi:hypothetical protein